MKRTIVAALSAFAVVAGSPASAALPVGAAAPDFSLGGALAGKPRTFSLRQALRKGPVVLYFFPAAFTSGCTVEAHLFAEATDDFRKLGATVVGVTAGNVERVAEFSRAECRDKFAVAADPGARVAARYQATNGSADRPLSNRTSFVIAPNGKILLSYTDPSPQHHVTRTLAAVRAFKAKRTR
jgi:thioredoxin-dependent peroxiredoxin